MSIVSTPMRRVDQRPQQCRRAESAGARRCRRSRARARAPRAPRNAAGRLEAAPRSTTAPRQGTMTLSRCSMPFTMHALGPWRESRSAPRSVGLQLHDVARCSVDDASRCTVGSRAGMHVGCCERRAAAATPVGETYPPLAQATRRLLVQAGHSMRSPAELMITLCAIFSPSTPAQCVGGAADRLNIRTDRVAASPARAPRHQCCAALETAELWSNYRFSSLGPLSRRAL